MGSVATAIRRGGVPKWLRERSAKPPCIGSKPIGASISIPISVSGTAEAVGHHLCDHHSAEMSVGADDFRHDGAVDYAESFDAEHAAIGIDYRARAGSGPHPARAGGVLRVEAVGAHPVVERVAVGWRFDHPLHH